jgi:hypothetical protein
VLGAPRGKLTVPVGGSAQIALSPGGLVHRSDGAELGIEVFGLQAGERADLRVLVAPLDDAGPTFPVTLRWRPFPDRVGAATVTRAPGAGPIVPWHAMLPLKNLKAGSWLVAVVVTDAAGRTARREGRLLIEMP